MLARQKTGAARTARKLKRPASGQMGKNHISLSGLPQSQQECQCIGTLTGQGDPMSYPQGFNPVGEHAPGLPRHDAPLPGHAPSGYTPTPYQDSPAPTCGSYTGNATYA